MVFMILVYDPAPVVARCRAHVKACLARLSLDAADDVDELPVVFAEKSRVTTLCGCFQHVAANGLGQITVYPRQTATPEKLEWTLYHEFAHALVHWMGSREREADHGKTWQYVMRVLGQEPRKYIVGPSDVPPETVYLRRKP
jgi:predicted SprT family Zn-dependent metalloprotease